MGEEKEKMTHEELVQKVLENQPDDEYLYDLSELFKIFGDSTRIKILYAMFDTELNVGDMAKILNLSQSSVSHQLRILKDSKLVKEDTLIILEASNKTDLSYIVDLGYIIEKEKIYKHNRHLFLKVKNK